MFASLNKLFPIDNYTYETNFGRYQATIIGQTTEISDAWTALEIEVEFKNVDLDFYPVRRLTILISPTDLKRDNESLFSMVMQWVFADPGIKNYFELEMNFAGSPALVTGDFIEQTVMAECA